MHHLTVAVIVSYDLIHVTSVGTESMESYTVNPIVFHMEWEELNNHQFLQPPLLVREF